MLAHMSELRGVFAAAVTPLLEGGTKLDEPGIGHVADFLVARRGRRRARLRHRRRGHGPDVCERERALETYLAAAGSRSRSWPTAARRRRPRRRALAAHAAEAGAVGVSVIAPPYFPLDDRGLLEHLVGRRRGVRARCRSTSTRSPRAAAIRSRSPVIERAARARLEPAGLKVSEAPWERFEPYLIDGPRHLRRPRGADRRRARAGRGRRDLGAGVGLAGVRRSRRCAAAPPRRRRERPRPARPSSASRCRRRSRRCCRCAEWPSETDVRAPIRRTRRRASEPSWPKRCRRPARSCARVSAQAGRQGDGRHRAAGQRRTAQGHPRGRAQPAHGQRREQARDAPRRPAIRRGRDVRGGRRGARAAQRERPLRQHDAARGGRPLGRRGELGDRPVRGDPRTASPSAGCAQRRAQAHAPRAPARRGARLRRTSSGSSTAPRASATSSAWTWSTRASSIRRSTSTAACAPTAGTPSAPCCSPISTARPADLESLLPLDAQPSRLVKGAYLEPPEVAYPRKADVDAAYLRLVEADVRRAAAYTAVATHDERLIEQTIALAERLGIGRDRFEFQMLYGVRSRAPARRSSRAASRCSWRRRSGRSGTRT